MTCKPHLALIGPMGAGKSSIGKLLAAKLGRPFIDLDRMIEEQAGAEIPLIFELEGEAGFRRREREMLTAQLAGAGSVIACGGGIVLDVQNRERLRERAYVIHLQATIDEQLARLARDRSRPLLLQTEDRRARLEALAAQREPLYAQIAHLQFHAAHQGAQTAASELAAQLDGDWNLTEPAHHD